MHNILVTGCAGFIGSHLCERLLKQGLDVTGLDNIDTYYSTEWKENNLKVLREYKNFNFVKGSISDSDLLRNIINETEVIYHLAAMPGVRNSIANPIKYCEVDVIGTVKLLDVSRLKNVKKFVFASSSSVYGEVPENELPISENRKPNPISPYGLAKLQGEGWCKLFARIYGLETASLRYFTVFGPRQRPDEAFTKFISKIINDEEIEIYGDGKQTRDFTFVSDVVEGTVLASKKGKGVYNIGGGSRINVNDMVALIEKTMNKKAMIKHIGKQQGDVTHTWSNIEKAKRDLGYGPKISIENGIKKHVEWYDDIYRKTEYD